MNGSSRSAWRKLWATEVPPEVKVLVCRFYHGIVSSMLNLHRRKLNVSTICFRCGETENSVLHAGLNCLHANRVWRQLEFNQELWNNLPDAATWSDFINAQARQNSHSTSLQTWTVPNAGMLKVNFNGELDSQRQKDGIGLVIRDQDGEVLGAAAIRVYNVNDLFQAEAIVIVRALTFAQEMGLSLIKLEGDSLAIIKKFKGIDKINHLSESL
ncbi:uncharacterized protein LOC111293343 [Durio zibethinus]|uniref:Uncharacterized protein LOC111293343 n=1 Tax=Durio zibethinus TaxID=66656 RepID=A0A6P5YNH7_DURZI|nr:uncharacterized protein LOC111293343 [Durio zibethinus]